jgi:DNA-binding transcriptional LysR family regulator
MHHIKVRGRLMSDNAQALYQLAILGVGIFRMIEHRARPFIRRGELVPLLERSHRDKAIPVHALYVRTNVAKPRVRAFVNFLIEKLAPDSHKGMNTVTASGRKRARRATVVV